MSLYPARELQLSNGVMLCAGHHLGIVHSHNASLDARRTDDFQNGWRAFVVMFDRFVGLAQNRDYNAANQSRL